MSMRYQFRTSDAVVSCRTVDSVILTESSTISFSRPLFIIVRTARIVNEELAQALLRQRSSTLE